MIPETQPLQPAPLISETKNICAPDKRIHAVKSMEKKQVPEPATRRYPNELASYLTKKYWREDTFEF